jgi:hypothetical protein
MNAYTTQESSTWLIRDVNLANLPAGAAVAVDIADIPAGSTVGLIKQELVKAAPAITDVDNLTVKLGDADDDDGFITAKSVLTGDTPIAFAQSDGAYATKAVVISDAEDTTVVVPGLYKLYTAAKKLTATFNKVGTAAATARIPSGLVRFKIQIL